MTERQKQNLTNVAEAATWVIPGVAVPKIGFTILKGIKTYNRVLKGSTSSTNMLIEHTKNLADKQLKDIGKMATKNVNTFLKIPKPTSYELNLYKSSQKVLNTSKKDLIKLTKTNIANLNKGLVNTKTLLKQTLVKEKAGSVAGDVFGSLGAYHYLTKDRNK